MLLILGLGFVLMLVLLAAGIRYYFPDEAIRAELETQLTGQLKVPVRIGYLQLNLLEGIRVEQVAVGGEAPFLTVDALVLDYDLTKLLRGRLLIHEVRLDHPTAELISTGGVWNIQPLLDLGKPATETPAPEKPTERMPLVPLELDLQLLEIGRIDVRVRVDDQLSARVEGLTIRADGRAGREGFTGSVQVLFQPPESPDAVNVSYRSREDPGMEIDSRVNANLKLVAGDLDHLRLSGSLGLSRNQVIVGEALPAPDTNAQMDVQVNLPDQSVLLHRLVLQVAGNNRIELSGQAKHYATDPEFQLTLQRGEFDIAESLTLAGAVSPLWSAAGNLILQDMDLAGRLKENRLDHLNVANGTLRLAQAQVNHPGSRTQLKNIDAVFDFSDLEVIQSRLLQGEVRATWRMDRARFGAETLNGWHQKLHIKGKGDMLADSQVKLSGTAASFSTKVPGQGTFALPVQLDASAQGNWVTGDFGDFDIHLILGGLLDSTVQGSAKQFGQKGFRLTHTHQIHLEKTAAALPHTLLQKTGLMKMKGRGRIRETVEGRLDEQFQPSWLKTFTQAGLKGVSARMSQPALTVKDLDLSLSFPAEMSGNGELHIPELNLETSLRGVQALDTWDVGPAQTSLRMTMANRSAKADPLQPAEIHTRTQVESLRNLKTSLALESLQLDSTVRAEVRLPDTIRRIDVKGTVSLDGAQAPPQARSGKITTRFAVQADDSSFQKSRAQVDLTMASPAWTGQEPPVTLDRLALTLQSRQNLKTGDFEAQRIFLESPHLLRWEAKGSVKNWNRHFTLDSQLQLADLSRLFKTLPAQLREALELAHLSGGVEWTLRGGGRLPGAQHLKSLNLPLKADSRLKLKTVHLKSPGRGLQVD
ncbi:MAG: hypothetical protein GWM98_23255, partial [Nitrospinaceae bacterium]|nr:hypothetical protein [Nitrospinaceae bacterium]NIR56842.1 hypothetical protein [Nitrospinaceae bacterium]NIT84162.1 hypothetical protein [Nitrospinaceae bacterium]NIU46349.1 hypothetical protein [Nitrospinaceae bacterium]NIW07903.1 hypothetical protein [Nitrospinaceae bacterium]